MTKDDDGKSRIGQMKARVSSHSLTGETGCEENLIGKLQLDQQKNRAANGRGYGPVIWRWKYSFIDMGVEGLGKHVCHRIVFQLMSITNMGEFQSLYLVK